MPLFVGVNRRWNAPSVYKHGGWIHLDTDMCQHSFFLWVWVHCYLTSMGGGHPLCLLLSVGVLSDIHGGIHYVFPKCGGPVIWHPLGASIMPCLSVGYAVIRHPWGGLHYAFHECGGPVIRHPWGTSIMPSLSVGALLSDIHGGASIMPSMSVGGLLSDIHWGNPLCLLWVWVHCYLTSMEEPPLCLPWVWGPCYQTSMKGLPLCLP